MHTYIRIDGPRERRTGIIFVDLEKVEVDIGEDSGGGVFEKVDSLGIAEGKDEEERGDDDGEAAVEIELVAEQRIARVGEEETVPLIAWPDEKERKRRNGKHGLVNPMVT